MSEKLSRDLIELIAECLGCTKGSEAAGARSAITQLLSELGAAQADRANALRAGWMMAVEAAATWVESGWNELPMRQEIAFAIRALTPPDGDEVALPTIESLAAILWREQLVDVGAPRSTIRARTPQAFADQSDLVRDVFLKYARAALQSIAGGGK